MRCGSSRGVGAAGSGARARRHHAGGGVSSAAAGTHHGGRGILEDASQRYVTTFQNSVNPLEKVPYG